MRWLIRRSYRAAGYTVAALAALVISSGVAHADPPVDGNNQSTAQRCIDEPAWAQLHPLVCHRDPFTLNPPIGGGGSSGGLLSGLLKRLGL